MPIRLVVLLFLCWCPCWTLTRQLSPLVKASSATEDEKSGNYVVVLKKDTNDSAFADMETILLGLSSDSRIIGSVQNLVKAITVSVTQHNLNLVSSYLL